MECMAIGGPSDKNPLLANLFNNSTFGVAPKNQTKKASSTETETTIDTANLAARIAAQSAQLRPKATDGFGGIVDADAVAKTAGASPINLTKLDKTPGITEVSALGEPSLFTALKDPAFGEIAASGNFQIASENNSLLRAARLSQAAGISGDFQVSEEGANLKKGNELLALVGNA
jgi:hypothetical protein